MSCVSFKRKKSQTSGAAPVYTPHRENATFLFLSMPQRLNSWEGCVTCLGEGSHSLSQFSLHLWQCFGLPHGLL